VSNPHDKNMKLVIELEQLFHVLEQTARAVHPTSHPEFVTAFMLYLNSFVAVRDGPDQKSICKLIRKIADTYDPPESLH